MAGIQELITVNENGAISFGCHGVKEKQKKDGFEVDGDIYKVKSHDQITRLEKNGRLLFESVPGTSVANLVQTESQLAFAVEGSSQDAQITVELEEEVEYKIFINQVQVDKIKANLAGKISFSVDFAAGSQLVEVKKVQ